LFPADGHSRDGAGNALVTVRALSKEVQRKVRRRIKKPEKSKQKWDLYE
jgi:hypothetical protein